MVYFQVGRWAGNAGGLCRRVGGRNFRETLKILVSATWINLSVSTTGLAGGGAVSLTAFKHYWRSTARIVRAVSARCKGGP